MFRYTVACTFDDPAVAEEWVAWLAEEHLREVCAAGARSAEVVACHGYPARVEVRYAFPSRLAFQVYERDHALRLREAGLARFPLERGLAYARSTGTVVAAHDAFAAYDADDAHAAHDADDAAGSAP